MVALEKAAKEAQKAALPPVDEALMMKYQEGVVPMDTSPLDGPTE